MSSASSRYISNPQEEAKELLPRYKFLYAIIFVATTVIIFRLWYLQIVSGNELREYSEKNRVKETKIPSPRGLFLDNEMRVLVDNRPGFEVTINPQYATKLDETAEEVGKVLNIPAKRIVGMVKGSRLKNGPFRPVKIKDNLSLDEVYLLKLMRLDHPGLNINQSVVRHYPHGETGAQLFGYVGEISKQQLERLNKRNPPNFQFEQGDLIGKTGIEEIWDREIRGKDGTLFIEVDARGRIAESESKSFFGLERIKPQQGSNLVLTVDNDLQEAAFKAMIRSDALGARIGGVVVMKTNGEILAWVNTPSFNPNEFSTGINPQTLSKIINDTNRPLRNKVIQDHFPPGSTFKPIMALAVLQEKLIGPNTLVYAAPVFKLGKRVYHDHERGGYGNITIYDALERSSNVFFWKQGLQLGIDRMEKYAKLFGIGSKTNVQIPNEVPGLMPSRAWKQKVLGEEWLPGENLHTAIGQGYVLTTALQMAVAYNAIATDGKVVQPFLVKKIVGPNYEVIKEFEPKVIRDLSTPQPDGTVIDHKNFKVVQEGMRRVVNGDHGTARGSRLPFIEIAGKTGTTQVRGFSADEIYNKCIYRPIPQRHHGWFVGYAPAQNPEIVVAVIAEHACSGSGGAAPVAKDVFTAYVQKFHPNWIEEAKHKKKKPVAPKTLPTIEEQEND